MEPEKKETMEEEEGREEAHRGSKKPYSEPKLDKHATVEELTGQTSDTS